MANILDYLKNLFSSEKKPATEANLVGQLDASTTDELKFMMKNSKGFLPISLETNLGSCSRIYDDELYHDSTSKSSGLWLAGVFRDKEGQKVFDLPIEDFDAETQKAVMTATREAFVDAQKAENHQKEADRLNDQLVEDATKELNARLNNDGKLAVISTPEKIFPTSVTIGEYKNGKISYRDVVAVAATVKDGKVLFYESEKDAKNARNPHFFDALSLNDKKQLLGVLVDSKVSDDIRISARESYLLHEADFKRSFEQYKKSEEQNQGKGVHR